LSVSITQSDSFGQINPKILSISYTANCGFSCHHKSVTSIFNQHHIGSCALITPRPVERTSTKLPCNYCRAHLEAIAIVLSLNVPPESHLAGSCMKRTPCCSRLLRPEPRSVCSILSTSTELSWLAPGIRRLFTLAIGERKSLELWHARPPRRTSVIYRQSRLPSFHHVNTRKCITVLPAGTFGPRGFSKDSSKIPSRPIKMQSFCQGARGRPKQIDRDYILDTGRIICRYGIGYVDSDQVAIKVFQENQQNVCIAFATASCIACQCSAVSDEPR
jgi:hypothetical protein